MKAPQKKSVRIAIVKPSRATAEKRASANRPKSRAVAIYEQSDDGTKETITGIEFVGTVTDTEKVELLTELVKSQHEKYMHSYSQQRYEVKWQASQRAFLGKKLKAALVMIRDFGLLPTEDDCDIPY